MGREISNSDGGEEGIVMVFLIQEGDSQIVERSAGRGGNDSGKNGRGEME